MTEPGTVGIMLPVADDMLSDMGDVERSKRVLQARLAAIGVGLQNGSRAEQIEAALQVMGGTYADIERMLFPPVQVIPRRRGKPRFRAMRLSYGEQLERHECND